MTGLLKTSSSFVLALSVPSTYPRGYACGASAPAASLEDVLSNLMLRLTVTD